MFYLAALVMLTPVSARVSKWTIALRYSAAAGDATLGELAEWDSKFAEPFAPGALISASGLSERRDFPSK